jgi:tRNA(Glu) U13 pseudouridine synthase TruD
MEKIYAKLKTTPEDFIVEETHSEWNCKVSPDFLPTTNYPLPTENSAKNFLWLELEKRDIETFQAIKILCQHLNKQPIEIGFAGIKDKVAHTSQRISIENPNIEKIKTFSHPNIILKNFKWNKRKIKTGYLDGNHFTITLRDIDKKDAIKITSTLRKTTSFPNYFGPQRFGVNSRNLKVGKLLLKRKFEDAAKTLFPNDRTILKRGTQPRGDVPWANETNFKDPIKLIRRLPRKVLLMQVQSVQSQIFNEIVEKALNQNIDLNQKGQQNGILAGYKTRFSQGKLGKIEQQILKNHNINLDDFDIREIPFLRVKGSFRRALVNIENLEIETANDEIFKPSKKITLSFTLPSGTYATTFLENFFTLEQPQNNKTYIMKNLKTKL